MGHYHVRDAHARPAPDLVQRHFSAQVPDALWVADITYIPTWAGFLYLALVLDAFSRRVVGWAMQTHLRAELVLQALEMAYGQRRPAQVVHHSDHGTQDGFKRWSQHGVNLLSVALLRAPRLVSANRAFYVAGC